MTEKERIQSMRMSGQIGGNTTLKNYGVKHFSDAGKKSRAAMKKRDPEYGNRLAAAGMHAREVKRQSWILAMLPSEKTPMDRLARILMGRG